MTHPEQQYLDLIRTLLNNGDPRGDRTGVGTHAIFGYQMRFNLADGFPAFTTKRVFWKTAFKEMLWMLSGDTNIRTLLAQNVHIWTDWPLRRYRDSTGSDITQSAFERRILEDAQFAEKWGDLGPVYGKQWRRWKTYDGQEVDQVSEVLNLLRNNPSSRRILWEGWNVAELDRMALPPCHKTYQFFVNHSNQRLSGACIQRSADAGIGLPFNIVNLALVTTLLALHSGYTPGEIIWFGLDTHLYSNHINLARELLKRTPRPFPTLLINRQAESLFEYTVDDFALQGYDPHPHIKAPIAV